MILKFYYTRDKDGDLYISAPWSVDGVPEKTLSDWVSGDGRLNWHRVVDGEIKGPYILRQLLDLTQLPEPSWNDGHPMEIYVNVTINKITYMYET